MRSRLAVARLPRDLHPVAWWLWAVGLAVAASFTTNPWLLLMLIGVACLAVSARRSAQPWADSFRLYLWLGLAIVVIRVVFRILVGGATAAACCSPCRRSRCRTGPPASDCSARSPRSRCSSACTTGSGSPPS